MMQEEFLRGRVECLLRRARDDMGDAITGMLEPRFEACSASEQSLTLRYRTRAWQRNRLGIIHGGITASLFDQTMGTLVLSLTPDDKVVMTADLNVSYLRPIALEETVFVRAQVKAFGKTLVRLYGEAFTEDRTRLCAAATSIFAVKASNG